MGAASQPLEVARVALLLGIVSVCGDADAVADFNAYPPSDSDYLADRLQDIADGLGCAILHASIKDEYPELVVRRCA